MATTTLIVEILAIGFLSLSWIFMIFLKFVGIDLSRFTNDIGELNLIYKILLPILITALAYHIGWVVDQLTYLFFYYVWPIGFKANDRTKERWIGFGRSAKREQIGNTTFWDVYNFVLQKCSQSVREEINAELAVVRISRTGVVNFLCIGLCLQFFDFSCGYRLMFLFWGIILMVGCYLVMWYRWRHWYIKIKTSYECLKQEDALNRS